MTNPIRELVEIATAFDVSETSYEGLKYELAEGGDVDCWTGSLVSLHEALPPVRALLDEGIYLRVKCGDSDCESGRIKMSPPYYHGECSSCHGTGHTYERI